MARTLNDLFQYRLHKILQRYKKQYDEIVEQGNRKYLLSFEQWIYTNCSDFGKSVLEDVENYCGLEEALQNEY